MSWPAAEPRDLGLELEMREDRSFLCSRYEFAEYAASKQSLVMEHFYRRMRRLKLLFDDAGEPVGGRWNFLEAPSLYMDS